MISDEVKALRSIASELSELDKTIKKIEKHLKPAAIIPDGFTDEEEDIDE